MGRSDTPQTSYGRKPIMASLHLLRGILDPDRDIFAGRQPWWSWLTLAIVWATQGAGRARTAIRLVWLNLATFVVLLLITIPVVVSNWGIVARQERLLLAGKFALAATLLALGICLLILRRQRRKLRRIEEMRRGLGSES